MAQAIQHGIYPPEWEQLAEQVKTEAGWCCVRCHQRHNPAAGYMLGVHHFDGNRGNNARWNLMALCQRCHLSIQARVNPAVPILYPPRTWAMPYIAGLYLAGGCQPSPGFDLGAWITEYTRRVGPWPTWAPSPGVAA